MYQGIRGLASFSRIPRLLSHVSSRTLNQHIVSTLQYGPQVVQQPAFHPSSSSFHSTGPRNVLEDKTTKSLTVWKSVKELRASPVPALALGLSGLIPFVAAPSYMMSLGLFHTEVAFAQMAYGATILSFLGGVRWGFTLPEDNPVQPDWVNLGYSVMPSLIAWGGLLMPHPFNFFTLMGGLAFTAYFDMAMYGYPPWFKGLRFILSFVAILSLWSTFMLSVLLKKEENSKEIKNDNL